MLLFPHCYVTKRLKLGWFFNTTLRVFITGSKCSQRKSSKSQACESLAGEASWVIMVFTSFEVWRQGKKVWVQLQVSHWRRSWRRNSAQSTWWGSFSSIQQGLLTKSSLCQCALYSTCLNFRFGVFNILKTSDNLQQQATKSCLNNGIKIYNKKS